MINPNGSISASAEYDKKLYRKINRLILYFSVIIIIAAAVIMTVAVLDMEIYLIVCAAVLAVCGAAFIVIYLVGGVKKFATANSCLSAFYRDRIVFEEYLNGSKCAVVTLRYSDFVKCKETQDYFLMFISDRALYPAGKAGLTRAELNAVRTLLALPSKGGENCLDGLPCFDVKGIDGNG